MSILHSFVALFTDHRKLPAGTTKGGIIPPTYKSSSLRSRIMTTPIPEQLTIPVCASAIRDSTPLVKVGDRVLKYQKLHQYKLAKPPQGDDKAVIIPTHAPTSGQITAIEPAAVANGSKEEQICIRLCSDGLDESLKPEQTNDYRSLTRLQLLQKILEAGIIDMEGAGFPTAGKLHHTSQQDINLLIINATECEPYVSADEALIRERAIAVLTGAEILKLSCAAKRCVIAIEDSKVDAIAALEDALSIRLPEANTIELKVIPGKYPTGAEKQLIQCLTGLEVPTGEHPPSIGILVQNAGTAFAVYEAVVEGKPCISRITTLTGNALQTPKNFEVLIGTSTAFLFDLCGIDHSRKVKTIVGGSLTGVELAYGDAAVDKTSNCLIAGTQEEFPAGLPEQACIRCGFCASVCPARLLPQQLLAFARIGDNKQLVEHGLLDCIECGACNYVCPGHIPLLSYYRESKNQIRVRQFSLEKSEEWQQRFQFHQHRTKKNKDQAEAGKKNNSISATIESKNTIAEDKNTDQEFFSKEKAGREIAAAVARVKARRSNTIANSLPLDKPAPGANTE